MIQLCKYRIELSCPRINGVCNERKYGNITSHRDFAKEGLALNLVAYMVAETGAADIA
jgi:hypothetical protein